VELGCFWHADFFHEAYFVPKKRREKSNLAFCFGLWKLRLSYQTASILLYPGGKKWSIFFLILCNRCAPHAHITQHSLIPSHHTQCPLLSLQNQLYLPRQQSCFSCTTHTIIHIAFHLISFQLNCLRLYFPNRFIF